MSQVSVFNDKIGGLNFLDVLFAMLISFSGCFVVSCNLRTT